ncbi:MAG: electron transport complex subunit RsxD [Gammaproteobacteria bacterium]|nr:electron transport complex subunit RsxD [Gammaproteobacteria bacterium]
MIPHQPLSSPHQHGSAALDRVMIAVSIALIPAFITHFTLFGWGIITNLLITIPAALGSEALALWLRRRPILPTLADNSALVTALLLALILPPLSPWWLLVTGAVAAILFAKQIYGGLGYNPFNPAMVGFVVLLISFPIEMTSWQAPLVNSDHPLTIIAALNWVLFGELPPGILFDSMTMATPLDHLKTELSLHHTISEVRTDGTIFGVVAGASWEWINLAILAGGLWLLQQRVIRWHVPVALLGTLALISTLFYLINPEIYADPLFHLGGGGAVLGAFFIATDPVSGATSPKGRLIFGAGAGLLIYLIRVWGGFPDGVAFAVLLMNMAAPTIDHYTQPRVAGHQRGEMHR